MSFISRRAFLGLAISLAAAACSRPRAGGPAPAQPPTRVAVVNNNFLEMTVYVVRGGQRVRLGVARSNTTTVLDIPSHMIFGPTSISFLADPIGSDARPYSQEITVSPGDTVRLVIR
jgi:hypothetical protein